MPLLAVLALAAVGGCPLLPDGDGTGTSPVRAVIGYSTASGPAPFTVVLSAAASTSTNAGPLSYRWDLGDGSTSDQVQVEHTYTRPGRYRVILRVTDATGAVGVAGLDVQVQGSGAVAIIAADKSSGPAPLTVRFDGTQSLAADDTVRDYFWNFGDGGTSQLAQPRHTFNREGQYTVTLRIVTQGGLQAETFTTITVGVAVGSLLFDGTSYATLPLADTQTLSAWTLEAWLRSQNEGGTVGTLGSGFSLEVVPTSNFVRIRIAGTSAEFAVAGLAGTWRHIAVTVAPASTDPNQASGAGLCTLYLDGAPVGSTSVTGTLTAGQLIVGNGLRGKVAEVRVWSVARTQTEINALRNRRLTAPQTGLLGCWPLSEGTGQVLRNILGSPPGMLGASPVADAADPAWSSDGPPL